MDNNNKSRKIQDSKKRAFSASELDVPKDALLKFLPLDFPETYHNGKIPLRIQIFRDKKVLHSVLSKPKKGVYMCNHCNKSFVSFGELLDHFDEFDIKRPFKCDKEGCPWRIVGFNKARQLQRHLSSVHSSTEFHCEIPGCGMDFKRMDLLSRHIKSVHQNQESRFNKKLNKQLNKKMSPKRSPSSPLEAPSYISESNHSENMSPSQSFTGPSCSKTTNQEATQQNNNAFTANTTPKNKMIPISALTDSDTSPQESLKPPKKRAKYGENSHYKYSIKFLTNQEGDVPCQHHFLNQTRATS